jgi:uncharacterized membrane protein
MKTPTVRTIALVAVMAAVVCVLTYIVRIPVPATNGYVHLGDMGANFAALAFGPGPGFLIAGGGMAIADLIAGYATYAPGTLVIHGLQAVVVAIIGRNRKPWVMFLAAAAGGAVVVVGYLLYQWLIMGIALTAVAVEVPLNILQVAVGLLGVPVYLLVARAYPPLTRWADRG